MNEVRQSNTLPMKLDEEVTQSNALPIKFQLIAVVITSIIISYLVYKAMYLDFYSIDPRPPLYFLHPAATQGSFARVKVKTGMTINRISEFNTRENKFSVDAIIWFSFDPLTVSQDIIEQFSFFNGKVLDKKLIYSYLYEPIGYKRLILGYAINLSLSPKLYYGYFPFDDHKLHITLENNLTSIKEMVFESSYIDFYMDKDVVSGMSWTYIDHKVEAGYSITKLTGGEESKEILNPRVDFEIDLFLHSSRYILIIIFPLVLIFYLELFSLCLDQRSYLTNLLNLSRGNIAALFAYKFVIENITPKIGYLTISDFIFFLFLSTSFIAYCLNAFEIILTLKQKKLFSICLQAYVIIVFIYLLNYFYT